MKISKDKHRKRLEKLVAAARHLSKSKDDDTIVFRDANGHFVFEIYVPQEWQITRGDRDEQ